ncbi:calponin [Basidiobolus ranarum]|uniref:Calponin n=1 Tax=Basidiobolus ranarum TaxID=34480 RepID=A0ABR2X2Y4_9FUNG
MSLPLYGIDRDLARKIAGKYDPERERQARAWIETVLGESLPYDNFFDSLHDGIILCKLVDKVFPGQGRYNTSKLAFKQMENINKFLTAAGQLGCPSVDLFQTVDLYEKKSPGQVVDAIFSFARYAIKNGLDAPPLGPKVADKHEVHFTPEQLNRCKSVINTHQMGYTKGANQSGMSFGSRLEISGYDTSRRGK